MARVQPVTCFKATIGLPRITPAHIQNPQLHLIHTHPPKGKDMDKIITPLITIIFVASGSAKLFGLEFELEAFERWGYPLWFMYFTGVVEVVGGLVIWVKRLRLITSVGLNCVMIGAIATHLLNAEWPMLGVAAAIFILTLINTWRFKKDIKPA